MSTAPQQQQPPAQPAPPMESEWVAELRKQWNLPPRDPNAPPLPIPSTAELIRQQRLTRFNEFCPAEFRAKIDRAKIPCLEAWDDADKWNGEFPGLWIWSEDTGKAKTRMLWRKFGHLHVRLAKNILRVTGINLAEEYHDSFNKSKTADFYRALMAVDVVMLDDLDKMALPEQGDGFGQQEQAARNGRMLRELFDKFYEHHVPVLVTANQPIEWFGQRIGASGERRMRECCRVVSFAEGKNF
jgi:hypothetical protein